MTKRTIQRFFEKAWGGRYGDIVETQAKRVQLFKMAFNTRTIKDQPDSRVIVSDSMLKFHENDRRTMYREKWKEALVGLGVSGA